MSRSTPIALAGALLCFIAGVATADSELSEKLSVRPGEKLVIDIPHGALEVCTCELSDQVSIEAGAHGLGAGQVRFELQREPNALHLRAVAADWIAFLDSPPRIFVRASVPSSVEVVLASEASTPLH
jgi:hypothetical protein